MLWDVNANVNISKLHAQVSALLLCSFSDLYLRTAAVSINTVLCSSQGSFIPNILIMNIPSTHVVLPACTKWFRIAPERTQKSMGSLWSSGSSHWSLRIQSASHVSVAFPLCFITAHAFTQLTSVASCWTWKSLNQRWVSLKWFKCYIFYIATEELYIKL